MFGTLGGRKLSGRTEANRIDQSGHREPTSRQRERRNSRDFRQSYDLHTMQSDARMQREKHDHRYHQRQRYLPSPCSWQERSGEQSEWHDHRERQIDPRERLGLGTALAESDPRGSSKSDRRDTASRQDDISNRSTEGISANKDTSERKRNEKRKSKHRVSQNNSESKKRKTSSRSNEKKHTGTATKEHSEAEAGELMEDTSLVRCSSPESFQDSIECNKNFIAEVMKVIVQGECDLTMSIRKLFDLLQSQDKCLDKSVKDISEELRKFPQCFIVNGGNVTAKTTMKCCEDQNCSCSNLHVCKYYLLNKCTFYNRCKFNHEIKSDANMSVLRNYHLHLMEFHEIQRIVRAMDSRNVSTVPTVCIFYNSSGGCRNLVCHRLDVCLNYVTGNCKLGSRCNRSHDLHDPQPKTVLERYGLFVDQIPDLEKFRLLIMSTLDENGRIVHKKRTPTTNPNGTMRVSTNQTQIRTYFSNNIRDATTVQSRLPKKSSDRKKINAETDSKEREQPIHIDQIAKKETDRQSQSDANAAFDHKAEYQENDEHLPSTNNDKRNNIDDPVNIPTLIVQTSDTSEQLFGVINGRGENKDSNEVVMTFNNEVYTDQTEQMLHVGAIGCDTDVGETDIKEAIHQTEPKRTGCTVGSIESAVQQAKMKYWTCEVCSERFNSKGDLCNHISKTDHQIIRYVCAWCFNAPVEFKLAQDLRCHVRNSHQEVHDNLPANLLDTANLAYCCTNPKAFQVLEQASEFNAPEAISMRTLILNAADHHGTTAQWEAYFALLHPSQFNFDLRTPSPIFIAEPTEFTLTSPTQETFIPQRPDIATPPQNSNHQQPIIDTIAPTITSIITSPASSSRNSSSNQKLQKDNTLSPILTSCEINTVTQQKARNLLLRGRPPLLPPGKRNWISIPARSISIGPGLFWPPPNWMSDSADKRTLLLEHVLVSFMYSRGEPVPSRDELIQRFACLVLPGSTWPTSKSIVTKMAYLNLKVVGDIARGECVGSAADAVMLQFDSLFPDSRDDDVFQAIKDIPLRL